MDVVAIRVDHGHASAIGHTDGNLSRFAVVESHIIPLQDDSIENLGCECKPESPRQFVLSALLCVPLKSHMSIQVYIQPCKSGNHDRAAQV